MIHLQPRIALLFAELRGIEHPGSSLDYFCSFRVPKIVWNVNNQAIFFNVSCPQLCVPASCVHHVCSDGESVSQRSLRGGIRLRRDLWVTGAAQSRFFLSLSLVPVLHS